MNRSEHLLACLAEECDEIGQRAMKALRFGIDEVQPGQPFTNGERIISEFFDLLGVIDMLHREGVLPRQLPGADGNARIELKKAKVEKFMTYAIEQGALLPSPTSTGAA